MFSINNSAPEMEIIVWLLIMVQLCRVLRTVGHF
nr:MAG TPA: hypothetical protein [Crassvirales sp.]